MKIKVPKDKGFLYDSADVYWPSWKSKSCNCFDDAVFHLRFLMDWLNERGLLNEEASKILQEPSLPKNFELRSWMLKDLANSILPRVYEKWVSKVKCGQKAINMKIIEDALTSSKKSH